MSQLHPGLYFALSLVGLSLVQRYFHQHLQRVLILIFHKENISLAVYALLLFPGVALHESSHWLIARLLGVRTRGFSLWPRRYEDNTLRLGYVGIHKVDAIRAALIGVAPLVTGTLFLALLRVLGPELTVKALDLGGKEWEGMAALFQDLRSTPYLLLWLYLALAVSNTMLPSKADMSAWTTVLVAIMALTGATVLLGYGGNLLEVVVVPLEAGMRWLAGLFTVTLVVDALLVIPILVLEWILSRLTGIQFE